MGDEGGVAAVDRALERCDALLLPALPIPAPGVGATTVTVGPDRVKVHAMPDGSRRIPLTLEVTDAAGAPIEPKQVEASLTLTSADVGPLPIALHEAGIGKRTGEVTVPLTGTWRLAVTVRTSAIDEATGYVDVPVG